ncbi:hypothetical protein [Priestia aryabhattai]
MANNIKEEKVDNWVEIYTDTSDFESFAVAIILEEDKDFYLLADLTPRGKADGFYLLDKENVQTLKNGTAYIKKIKTLYQLKQEEHIEYDGDREDLLLGLLEFSKRKKLIVSIVVAESDVYGVQGFVEEVDEINNILTITNIDSFGKEDGKSKLDLGDISAIAAGDENGSDLKLLHENN